MHANNIELALPSYPFCIKNTFKNTSKYLPKSIQNELKMRPGATLGVKTKPVPLFFPYFHPQDGFWAPNGPQRGP